MKDKFVMLPVKNWGTQGYDCKLCRLNLDGHGPSCVSGSGDSVCMNWGFKEIEGETYAMCYGEENISYYSMGNSCKKCKEKEFFYKNSGPHIGEYCYSCGTWQRWVKGDNTKTKEEYRNEYLDKMPATDQQRAYIRNLLRQNELSKYQASKIIEVLGGETL